MQNTETCKMSYWLIKLEQKYIDRLAGYIIHVTVFAIHTILPTFYDILALC